MSQSSEQFGRFVEPSGNSKEYLTLHFSPSASARQERWQNYGLSADFLGDYFSNFFPGNQISDHELSQKDTIKSAVSFIANELLENSIKYSYDCAQFPITLSLYLYEERLIFRSVNCAEIAVAARFKQFIRDLLAAPDIDVLFTQQFEKTAAGSGESCMGLLTMICDYGVELSWKFQPIDRGKNTIQVDALAYLDLTKFDNQLFSN
ncbi:MAG: ATP-binding protein [Spirulinaceae cyanobacterium RM2_2_10]|nr:ATP-binding protein [Spirulinaceae cyanobacterium SM2_1_0]NJO19004.1 ATP-binding protein [Spirulinaceae cyanobacterium RM2_2_10]